MIHSIQTYDPDQDDDLFEGEPESIWYSSSVEDFDVPEDSSLAEARQSRLLDLSQELEDMYEGNPPTYAWEDYVTERATQQHEQQNPTHYAQTVTGNPQTAMMSGALQDEQRDTNSEDDFIRAQSQFDHSRILMEQDLKRQNNKDQHTSRCISEETAFQRHEMLNTKLIVEDNMADRNPRTLIENAAKTSQVDCHCQSYFNQHSSILELPIPAESGLDNSSLEIERVIEQIKSKDTRQALHNINPSLSRSEVFGIYRRAINMENGLAENTDDAWLKIQSPPYDREGNGDQSTAGSDEDSSCCEDPCLRSMSTRQPFSDAKKSEPEVTQRFSREHLPGKCCSLSTENSHSSLLQCKPHLSDVTPTEVQGHHPSIIPRSPQKTLSRTSSLASGTHPKSLNNSFESLRSTKPLLRVPNANALHLDGQDSSSPFGNLLHPLQCSTDSIGPTTCSHSSSLQMPIHSIDIVNTEELQQSPPPSSHLVLLQAHLQNAPNCKDMNKSLAKHQLNSEVPRFNTKSLLGKEPISLPSKLFQDSPIKGLNNAASSMPVTLNDPNPPPNPTQMSVTDKTESNLHQHRPFQYDDLQQKTSITYSKGSGSSMEIPKQFQSDPFATGADMITFSSLSDSAPLYTWHGSDEQICQSKREPRKTRISSRKQNNKICSRTTRHRAASERLSVNIQDSTPNAGTGATNQNTRYAKIASLGVQGERIKVTKPRSTSRKASAKISLKPASSELKPRIPSLPCDMDLDLPLPELSTSKFQTSNSQSGHLRSQSFTPENLQNERAAAVLREVSSSTREIATAARSSESKAAESDLQHMDLDLYAETSSSRSKTTILTSKTPSSRRRLTPYPLKAESRSPPTGRKAPHDPKAARSISRTPRTPRSRKGRKTEGTIGKKMDSRLLETVVAAPGTEEERRRTLRRSLRVAGAKDG